MIGNLDHFHIMLYHQDSVPFGNKFIQHAKQDFDIFKMQSGSRFIQDIQGISGICFA